MKKRYFSLSRKEQFIILLPKSILNDIVKYFQDLDIEDTKANTKEESMSNLSKSLEGKLQITPLKFESDWILHLKVSEFGFYPLKFGVFGFYTLTFQNLNFTS